MYCAADELNHALADMTVIIHGALGIDPTVRLDISSNTKDGKFALDTLVLPLGHEELALAIVDDMVRRKRKEMGWRGFDTELWSCSVAAEDFVCQVVNIWDRACVPVVPTAKRDRLRELCRR